MLLFGKCGWLRHGAGAGKEMTQISTVMSRSHHRRIGFRPIAELLRRGIMMKYDNTCGSAPASRPGPQDFYALPCLYLKNEI
jgi:hypothetical protein